MVTIVESITVQASWLHGHGVTLQAWTRKHDTKFFRLTKADPQVVRLLTGHGIGCTRQLARTDIIETLMAERERVRELLIDKQSDAVQKPPHDDLGIDAPLPKKTRKASIAGALPEEVTIDAPSVGDCDGKAMKVLLGELPLSPLYVELTSDNVEYLYKFVSVQIGAGQVEPRPRSKRCDEDKVETPASNIVWAFDRGAFRARYRGDDGAWKTKDFRPVESEEPAASSAADQAATFMKSRKDEAKS